MTCGHCVASVTEEVHESPASTGVDVDLASGALTDHQRPPVPDAVVRSAVDEAGYQLA